MSRDELYEDVAIDATGVLQDGNGNDIELIAKGERDVTLHIDGTATASYQIEYGVHRSDGSIRWFTDPDFAYEGEDIHDGWTQPEELVRLRVTSAASAGDTADIYIALV